MKRILRSRLPERFASRLPPLLVEVTIGLALALVMTLARLALVPWAEDRAPYALVAVGIVGATVLAGWRSGLVTLVVGQLLAWFTIVKPAWSFVLLDQPQTASLILSTVAELVLLTIIALYQREVDRAWARQAEQLDLLQHALAEIDHRTANNYQTVLALVLAQAKRSREAAVRDALQQVATRIQAIGKASARLAVDSGSLDRIRLQRHLCELCADIEQGLFRPGLNIRCEIDDLEADAEQAVCLSMLINELVTNALKHAFPGDREGQVLVRLRRHQDELELCVEDDGVGIKRGARSRGSGLGNRLIEMFATQLGGRHEVESGDGGTRHVIRAPFRG